MCNVGNIFLKLTPSPLCQISFGYVVTHKLWIERDSGKRHVCQGVFDILADTHTQLTTL